METVTAEREERYSALDQFARQGEQSRGEVAAIPAFAAPVDRVVGAQKVAVYRDEARVLGKLKALAAAAGTDWYYRFPVKNRKDNRTDWIEGPSIKLANDLARLYGNCDIDVRVQDVGQAWMIYARFVDLETGYSLVRPFQQNKGGSRIGGSDDSRRLDIALQIGASKAIRNVTVNALQTFADFAFEEAKGALVEKIGKDIAKWRGITVDRIQEHVELIRVETVVGRKAADWLAPDIARIIAMMKAVQDGMATLDETFPPIAAAGEGKEDPAGDGESDKKLDEFAGGQQQPAADQKPAEAKQPDKAKPAEAKPAEKAKPKETKSSEPGPVAGSEGGEGSPQAPTPAQAAVKPSPDTTEPSGDGDPLAKARAEGAQARANKQVRKSMPAAYRKDEALSEAWLLGFDTGEAERQPGEDG